MPPDADENVEEAMPFKQKIGDVPQPKNHEKSLQDKSDQEDKERAWQEEMYIPQRRNSGIGRMPPQQDSGLRERKSTLKGRTSCVRGGTQGGPALELGSYAQPPGHLGTI
jgi:hypothetical protein